MSSPPAQPGSSDLGGGSQATCPEPSSLPADTTQDILSAPAVALLQNPSPVIAALDPAGAAAFNPTAPTPARTDTVPSLHPDSSVNNTRHSTAALSASSRPSSSSAMVSPSETVPPKVSHLPSGHNTQISPSSGVDSTPSHVANPLTSSSGLHLPAAEIGSSADRHSVPAGNNSTCAPTAALAGDATSSSSSACPPTPTPAHTTTSSNSSACPPTPTPAHTSTSSSSSGACPTTAAAAQGSSTTCLPTEAQAPMDGSSPGHLLRRGASSLPNTNLLDILGLLSANSQEMADLVEQLNQLEMKQQALVAARQLLEEEHVLGQLPLLAGTHAGRPVAAVVLYRCFLEWGLLKPGHGPQLMQLAGALVAQLGSEDESTPAAMQEVQQFSAHWLAVASILLSLLAKHAVLLYGNWYLRVEGAAAGADVAARALKAVGSMQRQIAAKVSYFGNEGLQLLKGRLGWAWGGGKKPAATAAGDAGGEAGWEGLAPAPTSSTLDSCNDTAASCSSAAAVTGAGDSGSEGEVVAPGSSSRVEGEDSDDPTTADGFLLLPAKQSALGPDNHPLQRHGSSSSAASSKQTDRGPPEELKVFLDTLGATVLRCYGEVWDQLKRRLTPLLSQCMCSPARGGLTPAPSRGIPLPPATLPSVGAAGAAPAPDAAVGQLQPASSAAAADGQGNRDSSGSGSGAGALPNMVVVASAVVGREEGEAELGTYRCWAEVVGVLHSGLATLRSAGVPRDLVATLMQQVLAFINSQLFNQLLLRPECCSAANARYALRGLKLLDTWVLAESEQLATAVTHTTSAAAPAVTGAGGGAAGALSPATSGALADAGAAHDSSDPTQEALRVGFGSSNTAQAQVACPNAPAAAVAAPGSRPVPSLLPWSHTQVRGRRPAAAVSDLGLGPWRALNHVRQALQFLVLEQKAALSAEEIGRHLCPALDQAQLYRLATSAWSDYPSDGAAAVSGELLEQMKAMNNGDSSGDLLVTCLLDDPTMPPPFEHPRMKGRIRWGDLSSWTQGRDYRAGLSAVPAMLITQECPAGVFRFLTSDLPAATVC